MSKWIEEKWLNKRIKDSYRERIGLDSAPSIDICFCRECKWEWTQKCPPHRMGLIHDESDYCSYGIRRAEDETD